MTAKADKSKTPGTLAPGVTVTIISQPGYARRARPNRIVSTRMKLAVMKSYGVPRTKILSYTMDHLIAIENGGNPGSPTDLTNVWPQPKKEAVLKDQQENNLHLDILAGRKTIEAAAVLVQSEWSA